jgi:hypothetical protein
MSSELKKEKVSKNTISNNTSNIDNALLQDFLGKVMSDLGGVYGAVLVYVGNTVHPQIKEIEHDTFFVLFSLLRIESRDCCDKCLAIKLFLCR